MGNTSPNDELNFTLLAVLALLMLGFFVQLWRGPDRRRFMSRLGILAMSGVLFEFAIKQAARAGHDHFTYVYLLPAALWFFIATVRRTGIRAVALVAVVLLAASTWLPGQPEQLTQPWYNTVALVTDNHYHHQQVELAQKNARAKYALSPTILAAIYHHPITVDPWEAALPWAYNQTWAPAPTMQTYVAYTPYLDNLNANSIAGAPMDRRIMRYRQGAIDARNALWDSPNYVLTELCSYRPAAADDQWLVLAKASASRCGAIQPLSQTVVHAGQPITLPTVGPNSILVMSFHEQKAGLLNRLGVAALKSFHPLRVTTTDRTYRLPRALATGPLIATLPSTTGWTDPFTRTEMKSSVSFNDSGTLEFSTIDLAN